MFIYGLRMNATLQQNDLAVRMKITDSGIEAWPLNDLRIFMSEGLTKLYYEKLLMCILYFVKRSIYFLLLLIFKGNTEDSLFSGTLNFSCKTLFPKIKILFIHKLMKSISVILQNRVS